ncbi:hypothetical protein FRC17_010330 [Serendipita sp. 399]|nr:hypothetical protein FRC17_010330 [Serendipita sp. 399]
MQRPPALRVVRSLRTQTRASTRKYATIPAPEPGFPTGPEFEAKYEAVKHHAAREDIINGYIRLPRSGRILGTPVLWGGASSSTERQPQLFRLCSGHGWRKLLRLRFGAKTCGS